MGTVPVNSLVPTDSEKRRYGGRRLFGLFRVRENRRGSLCFFGDGEKAFGHAVGRDGVEQGVQQVGRDVDVR